MSGKSGELIEIEAQSARRRKRLHALTSGVLFSETELKRVQKAMKLVAAVPWQQQILLHVEMNDGELVHATCERTDFAELPEGYRETMIGELLESAEERLKLLVGSHYVMTAEGYDSTTGCKVAIDDERRAAQACPFCKGEVSTAESEAEWPL